MHPSIHAQTTPEKPAWIMAGSGEAVTYGQLETRSNQGAHLLRSLGLRRGDCVALQLDNSPRFFEIVWAAQRSGLYYVCISTRLTTAETDYILEDSGAQALIVSHAAQLIGLSDGLAPRRFTAGDGSADDFVIARSAFPETPVTDESPGTDMLYSSGTTGRPKGIRPALPEGPLAQENPLTKMGRELYRMDSDTLFLSPAPLYHAAPMRWCMSIHRLGGTAIIMEKFDAEAALAAIERFRITHGQWVPTHFVRMLKLPAEVRGRYDHSSLKLVFHAAAPCPVPVKQAMLTWWGPIIHEFYAGTEANGMTSITPEDWLTHPGSVGRAVWGRPVICDDDGEPLVPGEIGLIYFADALPFAYHNDPEKTAAATNSHGWTTLGDMGRLDADGYLYLTDRQSFMIISGGVNIYPQEIENLLITHPKVADVAVVGAPHEDFGEEVVAVIQPADWGQAGDALAAELGEWLAPQLSRVKQPRRFDFDPELPRHPTGKLYKRLVRDRYWPQVTRI